MPAHYSRTADEALADARSRMQLEDVIHSLTGHGVSKYMTCPFCAEKKKFGTFARNGRKLFKCFNGGCSAHDAGDEIAFIMLWEESDRKTAFKRFLQLAGVTD
jgi:hypothetical protein